MLVNFKYHRRPQWKSSQLSWVSTMMSMNRSETAQPTTIPTNIQINATMTYRVRNNLNISYMQLNLTLATALRVHSRINSRRV